MAKKTKIAVSLILVIVITASIIAGAHLFPHKPAEVKNDDFLGICTHSLDPPDVGLVADSGAGWVRIDCNASDPHFGAYLENAKNHNLHVLAILDSWLFNGDCNFTIGQWKGKVTYYVSNYADYVDAWEIWNEPANPTPGWKLQNLSLLENDEIIEENLSRVADFYYSMAQTAYPIIRQYDGNATIVLLGGMNLYSGTDRNCALDYEFAKLVAAKGVQQYGDAISVHAYPWTDSVMQRNASFSYASSLVYYNDTFNRALPIWVTETGQKFNAANPTLQADYLTQVMLAFRGEAAHMFWYALHDDHIGDHIEYFGLVDDNMQPRGAYHALQGSIK
jgi:hypothetical protein